MAARLTDYPNGLQANKLIMDLLTAEPSGKIFSDGVSYATRIKAGGTYGSIWLESDGIHYNTAGAEYTVPLTSTSGSNSLDIAYDVGRSITIDAGPIVMTDATTSTADIMQLNKTGAGTGDMIQIDLDAGVGARAISIDAGGGARTNELIAIALDGTFSATSGGTVLDLDISQTGAAASSAIDIDVSSIYTGSIIDIAMGAAATTGYAINYDMNLGVAYGFMNIDCGGGAQTADIIDVTFDGSGNVQFLDVAHSNTGTANFIDIDVSGIGSGDILNITYSAASTGDAIVLDMTSAVAASALNLIGSGARTDDLIKIDDDSTSDSAVFDINIAGNCTGAMFDIATNTSTVAMDIFSVDMDTNVGGSFIDIDSGAATRTATLIDVKHDGNGNKGVLDIANTNTGTANVIDIDSNSTGSGNALSIAYVTAAHTGNAINLDMDTNVAGMALHIDSSATGTASEGSAINVTHDGALAANADLMRLVSSGSHNAASNLLYIEGSGASNVGTYAVNINASGTNIEALKVDAGGVVFDETLAVAGATTLTGLVTCAAGLRTSAVARTTTATGETTGQIAAGTSFVDLTVGGASEVVGLPQGALGDQIIIMDNTGTGFEIRPLVADKATTTMNGGDCSSDEEIAIGAGDMARCICTKSGAAGNWTVSSIDADGGITAGGSPD